MGTAIIIMSVLGPLVGVFAAWSLSRRDQRTDIAHQLFAKVFSDIQRYNHNFFRWYSLQLRAAQDPGSMPAFPLPYDPQMELKSVETELNTDCFMLEFLFDKKALKLGAAIHSLITSSEVFNKPSPPTLDDCQTNLNRLIGQVTQELKALHRAMRQDALDLTG